MSDVISQPKGNATTLKNGTIVIGGPIGAQSGVVGADYTIDTYVSNVPTTGTVFTKYKDRFDDYTFYSA